MITKEKDELNDSNFQKEGEYIITKKPKYKYEIKIIHDNSQENFKVRARTPDKIISSSKFSILGKSKKNLIKQSINIINNNNIYNNANNDEHYDNFNNYSNYNFYNSKTSKNKNSIKQESISRKANQNNKFPNKNDYQNYQRYKNNESNNYRNFNKNKNININNHCICQKEFDKILHQYFEIEKYMKNMNYNLNTSKISRASRDIYKNNIKENNTNKSSTRQKFFRNPLKIEKSIEKIYTSNNKTYSDQKPINYYESSNSQINKNIYNKNLYIKNIKKNLNSKSYLYINNKKRNNPEQKAGSKNKLTNYSFISINDSKNKNIINPDNENDKNNIKSQKINNNDLSLSKEMKTNQIMIYKSSDRTDNIKSIPLGQKVEPLIIKKTVQKPIIEKIKKEDGSTVNVMKQTIVISSIETKPINNKKNSNNKENLVKESITNVYTTLTRNCDENEEKMLKKNKSYDDIIDNKKDKNEKKEIFMKRKIINKNKKQNNIEKNNHLDNNNNYNFKEIYYNKNNNIINNPKKNFNIDISEISNDLLQHKNSNSSVNYSSLVSYEQIEPNNTIRINEEIKFIKYLYYRCVNSNSTNKAKLQSLSNYFLKLSDEEKIAILTNLNNGDIENKKIYNKLINILKEKRLDDENSISNSANNFGEDFISDYEEEEDKKLKNNKNIFKKKKVVK